MTELIINGKIEGIYKTKKEAKSIAKRRLNMWKRGFTNENSLVISYKDC